MEALASSRDRTASTPSTWPSERLRASSVNGDSFATVSVPHRTCAASATRRRGSTAARAATSSGARAASGFAICAGLLENWPLRSAMGVELAVEKGTCGGRRAEPHKRRRRRRRRLHLVLEVLLGARRRRRSPWWSGPTRSGRALCPRRSRANTSICRRRRRAPVKSKVDKSPPDVRVIIGSPML